MQTRCSRSWEPSATLENMRTRARLLAAIRAFFASRNVLEVVTPVLSHAAPSDIHIESLSLDAGHYGSLYLQTSPEFAMKRLLASGSGDIYQICPVFRAGEAGRQHNPEFTMLEWYRVGFDHHRLMHEVDELLRAILDTDLADTRYVSFADAFRSAAGLDPHDAADEEIRNALADHDVAIPTDTDRDGLLDLLLATAITAAFDTAQPTFVYDYPVSQAALARLSQSSPTVAERFELFLGGMELANGFNELCNADEQTNRFDRDLETRRKSKQVTAPRDDALLEALASGMPECAGVALGIDRLLMVVTGASEIASVVSFDINRA